MKVCKSCGELKPLEAFRLKKSGRYGRTSHCAVCYSLQRDRVRDAERARLYRATHPKRDNAISREFGRKYRETHKDQIKQRKAVALMDPENRLKYRVRVKFNKAVMNGYIEKPHGMDFHHPDYFRPYYGAWVCRQDHQLIHHGHLECPPCTDYATQVQERQRVAIAEGRRKQSASLLETWKTRKLKEVKG